jgi:hypothetical protein
VQKVRELRLDALLQTVAIEFGAGVFESLSKVSSSGLAAVVLEIRFAGAPLRNPGAYQQQ